MKTSEQIKQDIENNLQRLTGQTITKGTVIDLYNVSVSENIGDLYKEIENNRNPHIWSKLSGETLDNTGIMVNLPRKNNEDDETYKYRIMNWILSSEAGNETAISDALLNPTYASNISFYPCTKGSGTATCYVIPINYSEEIIQKAFEEAKNIIAKVASPSLYVEYIAPEIIPVSLQIFISSTNGDLSFIKENIKEKIKTYINSLAPGEYLEAGAVNKIGINYPGVDFFNIISILINHQTMPGIKYLQEIDSKMLFDEIIWTEG